MNITRICPCIFNRIREMDGEFTGPKCICIADKANQEYLYIAYQAWMERNLNKYINQLEDMRNRILKLNGRGHGIGDETEFKNISFDLNKTAMDILRAHEFIRNIAINDYQIRPDVNFLNL